MPKDLADEYLADGIFGNTFHLGPIGSGHTMKSINNLITALTFLATTEGLIIGKKSGLDPETMTDVLNESTGMSWISQTQIKQRITSRKFDDPFKLGLMFKDINIAVEKAKELDPGAFSLLALVDTQPGHGNNHQSKNCNCAEHTR